MTQTHSEQDQQTSPTSQQGTDEQSLYDQSFAQLTTISQGTSTVDWAREYFDSMERRLVDFAEQLRSARRVAEVAALGQHKQQIAYQAAAIARQQVLAQIRQDPTLRQQMSGSSNESGSGKRS